MHFLLQSGHKTGMMVVVGDVSLVPANGGIAMLYYWDPTYILVLVGLVVCLLAQAKV